MYFSYMFKFKIKSIIYLILFLFHITIYKFEQIHKLNLINTETNLNQTNLFNSTKFTNIMNKIDQNLNYTNQTKTDDYCIGDNNSALITGLLCFILVLIVVATAGGNFLVILAVIIVKKLQTPSNILIVSLAFSDFFVALLVLPFTIIDALKGYWPFNEGLCDMYISFDVLLCTSSILNLCAISIDRYLVITKPLTYIGRRTPCCMAGMIAAAWIGSALISIPPNFGWKDPFIKCTCEYSKNVGYQIYATFCAFYLPLIVMIVLYGRIFKLAREMSRSELTKITSTNHTNPNTIKIKKSINNNDNDNNNKSRNDLNVNYKLTQDNQDIDNLKIMSTHKEQSGNMRNDECTNGFKNDLISCDDYGNKSEQRLHLNSSRKLLRNSSNLPIDHECHRSRSRGNSETKVIKTLGVIMGCFCLCWLPFFLAQLLLALLSASGYNTENMIPVGIFRFLQWLGYVNSFLNPIIYAKFDREFRRPFKMILSCQCHNINARLRAATYSAQYGLPTTSNRRSGTLLLSSLSNSTSRASRLISGSTSRINSSVPGRPRPRSQLGLEKSLKNQTGT